MTKELDLADIQGNIIRAYGKNDFPVARYFFLHFKHRSGQENRQFIEAVRHKVTSATRWDKQKKTGEPRARPLVTLNIGFSFAGLWMLDLPTRTLQALPPEFIDGMMRRTHILGDCDLSKPLSAQPDWNKHWDKIWQDNIQFSGKEVHMWISMNAHVVPGTDQPVPELEAQTQWLRDLCASLDNKVSIISTNGQSGSDEYQSASAVFETVTIDGKTIKIPTPQEHFGFADGIGDPIFEGQLSPVDETKRVAGRGKWMSAEKAWEPLATGEFVLGHPDEAQEAPPAARPDEFMRNGSFMVYRKLHQNVGSYRKYFDAEAAKFANVMEIPKQQAEVTLKAKAVGRWPDGVPLAKAGSYEAWKTVRKEKRLDSVDTKEALVAMQAYRASSDIVDFKYGDDIKGYKCPGGAHLRRVNTRDYLDPANDPNSDNPDATTQLNKRRRILRRGLPYGEPTPGAGTDETEQGIAFMVICASIFRQFEFVQQQWIQYGLDFNQGNNTCPLLGNHSMHKRHTIPSDPATGKPSYICDNLPQFVETRGGEYFFLPSLTALRMMAMGIVDPT